MTAIEAIERDIDRETLALAVFEEQCRRPVTSQEQADYREDTLNGYRRRIETLRSALQQARVQAQYGLELR